MNKSIKNNSKHLTQGISKRNNCLTEREMEVLLNIAHEHTNAEIAKNLFLSKGTIATYRNNILTKLSTKNSAGMIRVAIERGLLILGTKGLVIRNPNYPNGLKKSMNKP